MDTEQIKQLATDINNVALEAFQSGKEHVERPLLAKIEQIQTELNRHKKAIDIAFNFISAEGDCAEQACRNEIEQALKEGKTNG